MKGPQLESEKVLHAFISRLASCSTTNNSGAAAQQQHQTSAGSKRSRSAGGLKGGNNKWRINTFGNAGEAEIVSPGSKQLSCFLESTGSGCKAATLSLPCLDLTERKNKFFITESNRHKTSDSYVQVVENLSRPVRFNKLDICQAPTSIHGNFCSTFQTLVDEHLRQTAVTLLQKAMQSSEADGMDAATAKIHAGLIRSLFPSKSRNHPQPIQIVAAVTNWVTTELSEDHDDSAAAARPSTSQRSTCPSTNKTSISHPIMFEAVLDLSILGGTNKSKDKVTLRFHAPGTISVVFSRFTSRIETAQIQLDCEELLKNIIMRCKEVVQKVVQDAVVRITTNFDEEASTYDARQQHQHQHQQVHSVKENKRPEDDNASLDRRMMPPPPPRPPRASAVEVDFPTKRRRLELMTTQHRSHAASSA